MWNQTGRRVRPVIADSWSRKRSESIEANAWNCHVSGPLLLGDQGASCARFKRSNLCSPCRIRIVLLPMSFFFAFYYSNREREKECAVCVYLWLDSMINFSNFFFLLFFFFVDIVVYFYLLSFLIPLLRIIRKKRERENMNPRNKESRLSNLSNTT